MEEKKHREGIDLRVICRNIKQHKRQLFIVWIATFVLSSLLILSVPRYYSTSAKIVPETENAMSGGALSSLASSFGLDLNNLQSLDAISPLLYPDLMEDNKFVYSLFKVHVKSADGQVDTDYATYLRKYGKYPWWTKIFNFLFGWTKSSPKRDAGSQEEFDPYYLSKPDYDIASIIRNNIKMTIDKKTGVISIFTKAQDPLICKTLADTAQVYLQKYIIDYRTKKARIDVDYYEKLSKEALQDYDNSRRAYAAFADANNHAVLQSVISKVNDLENDMQTKYNSYTVFNTQLQTARAKVQERTPAFTLLKGADVPIKPAGPKRMIFVISMLFLATVVTIVTVNRHYLMDFLS